MLDDSFGCTGGCCSTRCSTEACEGAGDGFQELIFFVVCLLYVLVLWLFEAMFYLVSMHDSVLVIMLQGV